MRTQTSRAPMSTCSSDVRDVLAFLRTPFPQLSVFLLYRFVDLGQRCQTRCTRIVRHLSS